MPLVHLARVSYRNNRRFQPSAARGPRPVPSLLSDTNAGTIADHEPTAPRLELGVQLLDHLWRGPHDRANRIRRVIPRPLPRADAIELVAHVADLNLPQRIPRDQRRSHAVGAPRELRSARHG